MHLLAEYLRQAEPRQLNLKIVSQVLGLPPLEGDAWMTVDWSERQPAASSEYATIRKEAKQHRTVLTRLQPTDLGLTNDAHPSEVIDLAIAWGYQLVPRTALEQLIRNPPPPRGYYWGHAVVLLSDAQYAHLEVFSNGHVRQVDDTSNLGPTWSVIVAC